MPAYQPPPAAATPPPMPAYPPPSPPTMPYPMPPSPTPVPPSSAAIKGGCWPSWLAEKGPPSAIPTQYFTHVFYSWVPLDSSTYQISIKQGDGEWMTNFTATLHSKNPPAKAFLSIGGGNFSPDTFSNMASSPDNRANFIISTIGIARKYNFDGLDLVWEFPNSQEDMSNLALLFKEWQTALEYESCHYGKPRLLLSAVVYFSSSFFLSNKPRSYPGDAVKNYVDFVNQMCFDYHGNWDTSVTGEHALLFDAATNVSTSHGIESWKMAGVPPEKLVMGLPLYGRTWKLKDPNKNGIGAAAVGVGPGTNGTMTYSGIVDFNSANGAYVVYDDVTVSAYSYKGSDWIMMDQFHLLTRLSVLKPMASVGTFCGHLPMTGTGPSQK